MIVATAGHVDHGKSTIVRRLTGTDPDRWAEERERGLTLDLGFAWTLLPSGRTVAFVDVPGHRRYVANALAGTAAVDGVLLAVSAREGWRAQTEEHVAMLELGGAPTGVVALTFADAVDGPTLRNARAAVAARLEGTFLEGAEIVPTRADGRRDGALRRALDDAVAACPTALDTGRPRLWIDRSFLLDGVGRVVTGTLTGGSVAVGDHVDAVEGAGATPLRIRSARRNGRPVERATPGGRVALAVRAGGPAPRRGAAVVRRAQ
ncbi:MAG: 50S ribosome-binding GTPase, partial [Microthrixaceae bacterium]|nr:50S ribosome-binding GTPase [Microthrixaceae bacterium]